MTHRKSILVDSRPDTVINVCATEGACVTWYTCTTVAIHTICTSAIVLAWRAENRIYA